jgi:hypothetical protein
VDGSPVLPGSADQISRSGAATATASQVRVESVVSDGGFWVGESDSDRVFVRLRTDGESPFQIEAGQTVSFEGEVTENPSDVEAGLGVTAAVGADLLQQQGRHVEVDEVQLDQEA